MTPATATPKERTVTPAERVAQIETRLAELEELRAKLGERLQAERRESSLALSLGRPDAERAPLRRKVEATAAELREVEETLALVETELATARVEAGAEAAERAEQQRAAALADLQRAFADVETALRTFARRKFAPTVARLVEARERATVTHDAANRLAGIDARDRPFDPALTSTIVEQLAPIAEGVGAHMAQRQQLWQLVAFLERIGQAS